MNDNVIISARDVKKHFKGGGIKALDGVSTDILRGEVVVVVEFILQHYYGNNCLIHLGVPQSSPDPSTVNLGPITTELIKF